MRVCIRLYTWFWIQLINLQVEVNNKSNGLPIRKWNNTRTWNIIWKPYVAKQRNPLLTILLTHLPFKCAGHTFSSHRLSTKHPGPLALAKEGLQWPTWPGIDGQIKGATKPPWRNHNAQGFIQTRFCKEATRHQWTSNTDINWAKAHFYPIIPWGCD